MQNKSSDTIVTNKARFEESTCQTHQLALPHKKIKNLLSHTRPTLLIWPYTERFYQDNKHIKHAQQAKNKYKLSNESHTMHNILFTLSVIQLDSG